MGFVVLNPYIALFYSVPLFPILALCRDLLVIFMEECLFDSAGCNAMFYHLEKSEKHYMLSMHPKWLFSRTGLSSKQIF
jgi:hypothetical protein